MLGVGVHERRGGEKFMMVEGRGGVGKDGEGEVENRARGGESRSRRT